jgi:hypothetical protein
MRSRKYAAHPTIPYGALRIIFCVDFLKFGGSKFLSQGVGFFKIFVTFATKSSA